MSKDELKKPMAEETLVVRAGRTPKEYHGIVNPPVYHASTVLSSSLAEWQQKGEDRLKGEPGVYYGRFGTPTTDCLTSAIKTLDHAAETFVYPSGVAAIAAALLSVLSAGDHLVMVDCVYSPSRGIANRLLKRYGISTTLVDSETNTKAIESAIQPNTQAIFLESPGSLTFEMQDIGAIAAFAKSQGIAVIMDNTWATPLYCKPLDFGVDLSITAATKYIVGHSDALLGLVSVNERYHQTLQQTTYDLGQIAGPDDCYLAQRGLRTMALRLERHHQNALALIGWLSKQPEVVDIRYPGWDQDPGYELWKRYFTGASGLLSFWLKPTSESALSALVDPLDYFGIGASWGGYESLIMPFEANRSVSTVHADLPAFRIHAGLEHIDDLIHDLEQGFKRMRAVA